MSKVSQEFSEFISKFLQEQGLTFRAAGLLSSVSAAYWKDMSDGRVPTEELLAKVAAAFDEIDENELRVAAGYAPRPDSMDAVKAVEIALRRNKDLSEAAKQEVVEFVRSLVERRAQDGG